VKPGEWETTVTVETGGQPSIPQERLDRMTPEQRALVEQALKARAAKGPATHTTKSCVKKEDLDKNPFTSDDNPNSCKPMPVASSRTKQEYRIDCDTSTGKRTGTIRIEAADSEHVKGAVQMTVVTNNRTMNINSNITGKWLGAACTESAK
jgi:hypothetical protein